MVVTPWSGESGAGHFVPLADWPEWSLLMQRACGAYRSHQVMQAMAWYQQCVALASRAVDSAEDDRIEQALEALFGASRCLADLQEDEGAPALAAQTRADLHQRLVRLMCTAKPGGRRSILAWYLHRTHSALLAHVEVHGPDPVVMAALRMACLPLHTAGSAAH